MIFSRKVRPSTRDESSTISTWMRSEMSEFATAFRIAALVNLASPVPMAARRRGQSGPEVPRFPSLS
ncbi:MAG TPA: hypothetical protein VMB23_08590, partial [Spirochaetia bacterium]|nr:hypothetical protein [Spirochaetia bacterium]